MFRPQRMPKPETYFEPCLPTIEQVNDEFICSIKSQVGDPLPPCENYDLKKMLDADLPLEMTNSKIIGSRRVSIPLEFLHETGDDKSSDKPSDKPSDSNSK